MHYNTTNLAWPELIQAEQTAYSQTKKVLAFLKENSQFRFTPDQVHKYMVDNRIIDKAVPLTSIRRALTDLHTNNLVSKSEKAEAISTLSKKVYTWRLA